MAVLIKMETDDPTRSPSLESWEDVDVNTPIDDGTVGGRSRNHNHRDLKHTIHVERGIHGNKTRKDVTKFQLPTEPIKP